MSDLSDIWENSKSPPFVPGFERNSHPFTGHRISFLFSDASWAVNGIHLG
jgi:hypothetical protein